MPPPPQKKSWTFSIAKKTHISTSEPRAAQRPPAREKKGPEYRLLVAPHLAERTQQMVTRIILETTKTFATFRYELSIGEKIAPGLIQLSVLGFKTPHLTLPQSGSARYQHDYEGLKGLYTLVIEGIDGRVNTFTIRISAKKVEIVKSPRSPFVELATEEARWTSSTT